MSKDDLRNKAHVKYLEHQFYQLAQQAGRAIVLNSTVPTCSSLSAYDEAMLKEFISNAKLLVNNFLVTVRWWFSHSDTVSASQITTMMKRHMLYGTIPTLKESR